MHCPIINFSSLDRSSPISLQRQIYNHITALIRNGDLEANSKMASTRELAKLAGVSRVTIRNTYDQLITSGYLYVEVGRGTFVQETWHLNDSYTGKTKVKDEELKKPTLSKRALNFLPYSVDNIACKAIPFNPSVPDYDYFPFETWVRTVKKTLIQNKEDALGHGRGAGYPPLRETIARNMALLRGIYCEPEQVIIVTSSTQAIQHALFLLLNENDHVLTGEPGVHSYRQSILSAGYQIDTVPVDSQGIVVSEAYKKAQKSKIAYVSPARHYPLGHCMSISRRQELLEWAKQKDAWIIEDDYCSQMIDNSGQAKPITAMDQSNRSIYLGVHTEDLFPGLRLAYMVAPKSICKELEHLTIANYSVSNTLQPALNEFIKTGQYRAHINKIKQVNKSRELFLSEYLSQKIGHISEFECLGGGYNFVLNLPKDISAEVISKKMSDKNIICYSLHEYYLDPSRMPNYRNGLNIGFSCAPEPLLKKAADILVEAIQSPSR